MNRHSVTQSEAEALMAWLAGLPDDVRREIQAHLDQAGREDDLRRRLEAHPASREA